MNKRILYLLLILAFLFPQARIVSAEPETTDNSGVRLITSNSAEVIIELLVPEYDLISEEIEDIWFDTISIPEIEQPSTGKLPQISVFVGVPANANPELSILVDKSSVIPGKLTLPPDLQPARISESFEPGKLVFQAGSQVIAKEDNFPGNSVKIGEDAWIRNQRIVRVDFYPFQYSASQETLTWHQQLRVQVRFEDTGSRIDGVPVTVVNNRVLSGDSFEGAFKANLINYEEAQAFRAFPASTETGLLHNDTSFQPGDSGFKIEVNQDGLYELTYTALQIAGMDVVNLDPTLLVMSSQGQDVALYVENEEGDEHNFSPSERVLFYGQKFSGEHLAQEYASESSGYLSFPSQLPDGTPTVWHPQFNAEMLEKFTDTNVYWLRIGASPGLRMALVPGNPHDTAPVPPYYTTTVRAEQSQHWYSFNFTSEDTWYWDQIQDTAQHNYQTTLTGLASGTYSASIRGEMVARSSHPNNNPDHHTRLWLNSQVNPFIDVLWDGISRYRFEASIPSNQLVEGTNHIRLGMLTDAYPSQLSDWLYFDWYEIDYRRQYQASSDQITFFRDELGTYWQYQVSNFISPEVTTLNITNPLNPQLITGTRYLSGTLAFEAIHSGEVGYLVVGSNAIKTPFSIAYYQPPDLLSLSNQYDYLIITQSSLVAAAQALANYRTSQGLTARIVDVNDLYNLFNYGIYHSIAIKNFLKYTFTNWAAPPSYVVLIGDGHWNLKGYTGPLGYYSPPIYLPPHLSWVDPWQGEVDSANLLGAVVGNDPIADVHIGRIPVNNAAELNAVVNKIIAYEQAGLNTWQKNIIFVADNVPDPAGDFIAESEQIITDYVESGYTVNRIYENAFNCSSYPCPLVNHAITNTLNTSGAFLVNYDGHASVNRWSHEHIFTNPNIQSLLNSTRYPVVVSLTCLDGYWIHPGGVSPSLPASGLMEDMLRAANKGAVATFSPTGLGVATGHEELWRGFYQALFKDSIWNLGDATLAAKLRLYASGANYDLLHTFTLFGDPALRVKDPYTFGLTPTTANRTRPPGSIVNYTLQLTNNGLVPDTFTVSLSGNQWIVTAPTTIGPVNPGVTTPVPITVYVSFFAANGAADITRVAISSQGDTSETITATLTTMVELIGEQYLNLLPQIVK